MSPERRPVQPSSIDTLIRQRIHRVAQQDSDNTKSTFITVLDQHFDDLPPIDFSHSTTPPLRNSVVARLYTAFSLGYRKTHGDFPPDSVLDSPTNCIDALQKVLREPVSRRVFDEKLPNLPVTFIPARSLPFSKIVSHEFGDKQITAVDLGSGPAYMLPTLSMPEIFANDVWKIDAMPPVRDIPEINMSCGVNVDILPQEEAILRAKANNHQKKRDEIDAFLAEVPAKTFPFVRADILNTQDALSRIQQALVGQGEAPNVDLVVSSFVRYQFGSNIATFRAMEKLVKDLLKDGGMWLDVGWEFLHENANLVNGIDVYKKTLGKIVYEATPITMSERGKIVEQDEEYFISKR